MAKDLVILMWVIYVVVMFFIGLGSIESMADFMILCMVHGLLIVVPVGIAES